MAKAHATIRNNCISTEAEETPPERQPYKLSPRWFSFHGVADTTRGSRV